MMNQDEKDSRRQARRFIRAQLITTVVLSLLSLLYNETAFYSALAGGSIATVANAWFALKVFRLNRADQPAALLTAFYVGEIYKFIFTAAMFVVAFVLIKPVNIVVLLTIYFFVHLTPAVVNTFGARSEEEN